ncbi:PAS domain S-box protein [Candidatus Omnitrophota bacterium]
MANPLSDEKKLYERIRSENIAINKNVWDFMYRRVNENTTSMILICQRWLKNQEAMPIQEAGRILGWTRDIKNTISAITAPTQESQNFPQFQDEIPLNSIVKELITHQFGNDIFAIELMLQDAIDLTDSEPVSLEVVQKILVHTEAIKGFLEKFRDTIQWKESEEKYHNLYDSFQDGLVMTDMKGHILEVNQAYLSMLNYTKEEIAKLTYQQLTPKKWQKIENNFVDNFINKRVDFVEYEKEYIKKDGTVFPINLKVWLIKDKQDNPLGMWGIVRDITESKKAQREIEKEIFASHNVIDNISVGLSLSDKRGRFVIFNSCLQEITGYTMEEINKQDLGVLLYPDFEDRKKAFSRLGEITTEKGISNVETIIKTKDGSERIVSLSTSLIDYKGSEMFLSIWRNITERKHLQDALQDSETRFRRLFETAQDGILILDADTGQIREANKFLIDMLGYSREEFLGKKLWEVGAFIDTDKCKTAFKELQAKEYIRYEDLPLQTGDGRIIDVEFISNVYKVDHTKVIQCNIRNITERKHLQDALQDSETRFRRLFETAQDGILILDADTGQIREANKFLIDMLGYSREEFLGKKLWEVGAFIDTDKCKTAFQELQAKEYIRYEDLPLQTGDGRIIDVEFISNVYKVDHTKVIQCNIRNITLRKEAEEKLKNLASHDQLTGCVNFRLIMELLESEIARSKRHKKRFGIIMTDIDQFKRINDEYGHMAGNDVLVAFANIVKNSVRSIDVVGRYGGDEFIIILPESDSQHALVVLERIRNDCNQTKITSPHAEDAGELVLKLSAGIAVFPDNAEDLKELIWVVDSALRQAKREGKNRAVLERRGLIRLNPMLGTKIKMIDSSRKENVQNLKIANISRKGMLLLSTQDILDKELLCRISCPKGGSPFELACKVKHKGKSEGELHRIGVNFPDIPKSIEERLSNCIESPKELDQ